jgi:hypothetical protein
MTDRRRTTAVCAAILALAPLPLLSALPRAYVGRLDYLFAVVAAPAAVVIACERLRRARPFWAGHRRVGRLIVVLAALALLAAAIFSSAWIAGIALLLTLAALAWEFGGWPALKAVAPALVIGGVCLPLPLDLDRDVVSAAGRAGARWSSHLLDMLGVAHVRAEHVIVHPGGRLDFGRLFGGLFSPLALIALLLSFALVLRRGFVRTAILSVSGMAFFPVVTAAVVALRLAWFGGAGSDALWSAGCFGLAVALALSVDQLAGVPAAVALRRHVLPSEAVPTIPLGPPTWAGAVGPFAAAVFIGLAGLQIWAVAAAAPQSAVAPAASLPDKVADWVAAGPPASAPPTAVATARYHKGGRALDVVVMPAVGVDGSPTADFEKAGWVALPGALADTEKPEVVRTGWEFPAERFATVWMCGLTDSGRLSAPSLPLTGTISKVKSAVARAVRADVGPVRWWVRAVLVTTIPPGPDDLHDSAEAVRNLCDDLAWRLKAEGRR